MFLFFFVFSCIVRNECLNGIHIWSNEVYTDQNADKYAWIVKGYNKVNDIYMGCLYNKSWGSTIYKEDKSISISKFNDSDYDQGFSLLIDCAIKYTAITN